MKTTTKVTAYTNPSSGLNPLRIITWQKGAWIVCCLMLFAVPLLITKNSYLFLLTNIFIWSVFAMSYNLLLGFTGIISFGHAMFFGIGAYSLALTARHVPGGEVGFILAILATVVICFVLSLIVGLLSLRLRDTFYALITLAVATIFVIIAEQWRSMTMGNDGFNFTASLSRDLFGFINLLDRRHVYYIALIFLIGMFLLLKRFIDSPVGRTLQAIRDNEARAASLGYAVLNYKLISNILAGVMAGLAGVVYAISIRFVSPDSVLGVENTIDVLLMTVIGGVGTLLGPIIGAAVVEVSSHYLMGLANIHPIFERWVILFGVVFILIILFFPAGIVGTIKQKFLSKKKGVSS
ncbi:branched-chain amino acid transport system permease protein [Evansella vedderi]|uniref:Branched-chain amino acid transport system permease protein n=1 Tax=Evansella vedderi TaxID=38282 RepID=A0ABU0A090_9BACI|nr:branched-chain amino acid ABC transporter permease [Evansella vedderi]MDQ0256908.1 branched-chain amino acid transport system permease protein [Evansella vedderi]